MGVQIDLNELQLRECDGKTPARHAELAACVESKIVAVDGNLWLAQARQTAGATNRMDGFTQAAGGNEEDALQHSAIMLFVDRCTQLLRYGAHPVVVFDGPSPMEKRQAYVPGRPVRDVACNAPVPALYGMHATIKEIMQSMGVAVVAAPGEGECMCAALVRAGKADLVWTHDVIDALLFGASTVFKGSKSGREVKKCFDFGTPSESKIELVSMAGVRQSFGLDEGGDEALTVLAVMTGTDYNRNAVPAGSGGVKGIASAAGRQLVSAMLRHYQAETGAAACTDAGFVDAFCEYIAPGADDGAIHALIDKADTPGRKDLSKKCFTALRAHPHSFAQELRDVAAVFARERRRAAAVAAPLTRGALEWTGERLDHGALVRRLRGAGISNDAANGCKTVLHKVVAAEVERMARSGEARQAATLLRVEAAAPRTHKKEVEGVPGEEPYQYLVDLAVNQDAPLADAAVRAELLEFLNAKFEKKTSFPQTWRYMRPNALNNNFPAVKAAYVQKQQAKADKVAATAQRKAAREAAKQLKLARAAGAPAAAAAPAARVAAPATPLARAPVPAAAAAPALAAAPAAAHAAQPAAARVASTSGGKAGPSGAPRAQASPSVVGPATPSVQPSAQAHALRDGEATPQSAAPHTNRSAARQARQLMERQGHAIVPPAARRRGVMSQQRVATSAVQRLGSGGSPGEALARLNARDEDEQDEALDVSIRTGEPQGAAGTSASASRATQGAPRFKPAPVVYDMLSPGAAAAPAPAAAVTPARRAHGSTHGTPVTIGSSSSADALEPSATRTLTPVSARAGPSATAGRGTVQRRLLFEPKAAPCAATAATMPTLSPIKRPCEPTAQRAGRVPDLAACASPAKVQRQQPIEID